MPVHRLSQVTPSSPLFFSSCCRFLLPFTFPAFCQQETKSLEVAAIQQVINRIKLTESVNGKKSSTPLCSPDLFSTNTLWSCTQPWQMFFRCSEFKASRMSLKISVISCKKCTSLNVSVSSQSRVKGAFHTRKIPLLRWLHLIICFLYQWYYLLYRSDWNWS